MQQPDPIHQVVMLLQVINICFKEIPGREASIRSDFETTSTFAHASRLRIFREDQCPMEEYENPRTRVVI